ncbi:sigma-70 family RNA polymerase sigma factor [Maricaulis sp. D1M11]|uniref:sigma-70 family RNA polymerase sigma factor n=1 Tax=Maricaulis sp. D1M11 TaxID=3076117 RepID=UPI0039B3C3B3
MIQRPRAVEASLWRRLRFEGQRECREKLFQRKLTFAKKVAGGEYKRMPSGRLDRLDFNQLAFIALLEAIDRYDPKRGSEFDVFARPRIRGAILDGIARSSDQTAYYAASRRQQDERLASLTFESSESLDVSISQVARIASGLALGLIASQSDTPPSSRDGYESHDWIELRLTLQREIQRLPERERYIVERHYIDGVSFSEIANAMNVSTGRVSQLHRKAIARIQSRLTLS